MSDDVIRLTTASGTLYISNQDNNDILAAKVTDLNTGDLYATVGSNLDRIDPSTRVVTPILTGLNAAHGLLFAPSTSGAPDLNALPQVLSQDFTQVFASLASFTGQTGPLGSGSATLDPSIPSVSIINLISGNASNALAGLLPVANA